jgi:8-amino-7-oxononanoate synthase
MDESWSSWLADRRADLEGRQLLRRLRPIDPEDGFHGELEGRPVVLFCSNDYLGLSTHPAVLEALADAGRRGGTGPRGAALICGYTSAHAELERELARLKGTESALLFPTGYAANLAVLTALSGPGTAVFSDAGNHASIIDGCRLAGQRGAEVHVYDHADPGHLSRLLADRSAERRLIVTDTIFSMDGDVAPLRELVEVKRRHGALLAVDEAHAVLVLGEGGGGAAEAAGVGDEAEVQVGTLGKAFGAHGGFVACSEEIRRHVLNLGRSFVYSTALPVPVAAAALAALRVFRTEPEIRARLRRNTDRVADALEADPETPIFPLTLGDEDAALAASQALLERGYLVPAIRPPTVPPGSSRLRITVSAAHTEEEVTGLLDALRDLGLVG